MCTYLRVGAGRGGMGRGGVAAGQALRPHVGTAVVGRRVGAELDGAGARVAGGVGRGRWRVGHGTVAARQRG